MGDREQARQLLVVARKDRDALRGMIEADVAGSSLFDPSILGFHAQQAAEKALKAWLACLGLTYPFTHDLQ